MFRQLNQALRRKDHYIHDAVVAGIATIDTITMHHAPCGEGGGIADGRFAALAHYGSMGDYSVSTTTNQQPKLIRKIKT